MMCRSWLNIYDALLQGARIKDIEDGRLLRWYDHAMKCRKCNKVWYDSDVGVRWGFEEYIEDVRDKREVPPAPRPPLDAEFLLHMVLPEDRIDDAIGDLDERFTKKVERLGITRANIWYCKQVTCSIWPYAKAAASRMSSGLVAHMLVFLLRVLGQNGLAEAILQARAKTKTP
jgi:hypothetical protein